MLGVHKQAKVYWKVARASSFRSCDCVFFPPDLLGKFCVLPVRTNPEFRAAGIQTKAPDDQKKCNCKKFRLLSYLGFWEIKDWSFSGLFISSFFSPLFCCFTLKTPILSLKKKFLMGMPGGHLLHTRLCFRLVKLDASVCHVKISKW